MIAEALGSTPITKKALAEKLGTDTRSVELLIHAARLEGVPICSNSDGYFLSDDPEQIRACARWLRSKLISQSLTTRALLRTARRLEAGPLLLWRDAA